MVIQVRLLLSQRSIRLSRRSVRVPAFGPSASTKEQRETHGVIYLVDPHGRKTNGGAEFLAKEFD